VPALQAICDSFGPAHIESLLRKWLAILPNPFTPDDEAAGYRYELSILQAEFSLTQMLDRPVSGRIFFEQVMRDNLDIGRPDQIGLVFDRRIINGRKNKTPGRFRTRVITEGVTPSLHVDYKNSKIKQYHKEGRAIRTETTINDPGDFGLAKRLTNLAALRQIGFPANRRLLGVQRISHDPVHGAQAFTDLTAPIVTDEGTRIPGLRFGDTREDDLRPTPAPRPRHHRTHPENPPLPGHRPRAATRPVVHPRPRPPAPHWPGPPHRPQPTHALTPAHRRTRLPERLRSPRRSGTPGRLTPKPAERHNNPETHT
jgi:hypothetical protein